MQILQWMIKMKFIYNVEQNAKRNIKNSEIPNSTTWSTKDVIHYQMKYKRIDYSGMPFCKGDLHKTANQWAKTCLTIQNYTD